jgi:hypothetical protein
MIKAQVGQLLEKEMDRKDFLRHIGVAVAVIAGVPTLLSAINRLQAGPVRTEQQVGYGSSAYGGDTPRQS